MKNKIKETLIFLVGISIIVLLGFTPVAQVTLFSLNWGNTGVKMAEAGVIDKDKFENLYNQRGGMTEAEKELFYGSDNENFVITPECSKPILRPVSALYQGRAARTGICGSACLSPS